MASFETPQGCVMLSRAPLHRVRLQLREVPLTPGPVSRRARTQTGRPAACSACSQPSCTVASPRLLPRSPLTAQVPRPNWRLRAPFSHSDRA